MIERVDRQRVQALADVDQHGIVAFAHQRENPLQLRGLQLGGLERVARAGQYVEVRMHVHHARIEQRGVEMIDLRT